VEPIFLKRRSPDHARCYACHAGPNSRGPTYLEKLSAGNTFWTEEQSRRNFEIISVMVVPGNTARSYFLMHPLAPEAGGHRYHGGGRQFASQNDPDWRTMADWVRGRKASDSSEKWSVK
jgi:hypothetical protein